MAVKGGNFWVERRLKLDQYQGIGKLYEEETCYTKMAATLEQEYLKLIMEDEWVEEEISISLEREEYFHCGICGSYRENAYYNQRYQQLV